MSPYEAEAPLAVAAGSSASKPNPRNNVTMFKIFQNVQYNVVQHKKYVKEMIKLYKKLNEDEFRESFRNALQYLFTFGDTSANVDRVIQFVATFCTSLDDEEEFLLFIFDIIFDCQCVSGQSVRYRASQLLAAVLQALGNDAELDDDLCDKLLTSQMERLEDTRGAVRCRAALALQRLQNPPDDEVTRTYRFHMMCDPSASVRRATVMVIAKTVKNVPYVLERLCDVDEAVRRAAFLYMAAMNVTQLRVTQRILVLKVGLTERSPRVRRVVEEILIPGWLSAFRGDIVELLKAIRLDNAHHAKDSQYVAGKLLESLFKRLPISELLEWLPTDKTLRVIPAERLNKETAWYWRHLAEHLQAIDDDETLETVLPDLVVLTGYIRVIVESPCPPESEDPVGFSTRQSVLRELGSMLRVYDATDPAGRAALQTLVTDVLTGDHGPLNADVIRAFVSALELVIPDVSQRMEVIASVINALRDPVEPDMPPPPPPPVVDDAKAKMERARLRVSLNVAIEAQEEAVRDQNYALAAECKAKVEDIQKKLEDLQFQPAPPPPPPAPPTLREKISDSATLNKCLTILNSALDTPQLTAITPALRTIYEEFEVELLQNPDILEKALETVALYGMLDKTFVTDNKAFFFVHMIDMTNEPVLTTVLRCLVDLMCVHGPRVFEEIDPAPEDTSTSMRSKRSMRTSSIVDEDGSLSESLISASPDHSNTIQLLVRMLDNACPSYRLIIVEGLCRLLHLGHLESPTILCRLLLLWFNPATREEDMLRQSIGVFFQTFPVTVEGAQEQIQKATVPVLRALANAPTSSPLAEVDQEAVVRFIVSLTRVNHELTDSQGGMAMLLSNHIVRRPNSSEVGLACRMLALLSPPRDGRLATELAALLRDVCDKLPDKQSVRNLTRYIGNLEAAERLSLNKMSNTGVTEGTLQTEDTLNRTGRNTTSLPQPIARSTHVVINETVEEEVEIDETSPAEPISRISEGPEEVAEASSPLSARTSSGSDTGAAPEPNVQSDSSSGVSPVKKAKVSKAKKKKLSITKQTTDKKRDSDKEIPSKDKHKGQEVEKAGGGVKRSRSQRSLVDVDRAQKAKAEAAKAEAAKAEAAKAEAAKAEAAKAKTAKDEVTKTEVAKFKKTPPKALSPPPFQDLDVSNVTVRRSTRGPQPGSSIDSVPVKGAKKNGDGKKGKKQGTKGKPATRSSTNSARSSAGSSHDSMFEDSGDETQLHTIVYEKEFEQSLLNDSSELADSKEASKNNVTIPETPEGSEASESEPEPEPVKAKGKRNGNKK